MGVFLRFGSVTTRVPVPTCACQKMAGLACVATLEFRSDFFGQFTFFCVCVWSCLGRGEAFCPSD